MRSIRRIVRSLSILGVLLVGSIGPLSAQERGPGNVSDPWVAAGEFSGGVASEGAIGRVREAGQAGREVLEGVFATYRVYCDTGDCGPESAARDVLDRMCGVRDCADLRLFWYTDLDAAVATARREGKAVLSLRLMGRLDEELSCANSRFFRTAYYPDPAIAELLRERYVLHWSSVAPVPKVTIEVGDGRRIERTVTGNSLHYVLDGRGRPVLALPGLMAPKTFRRALETVAPHAAGHSTRLDDAAQWRWAREAWTLRLGQRKTTMASAVRAVADTGSKAPVETPLLRALRFEDGFASPEDPMIVRLAERRRQAIELSPESRAFLLAKHGETDAERGEALIDSFETSIALDEVIDLYRMEPAILEHLLAADGPIDLEKLTDWIYREVFETPLDDPFLGLAPDHVYAALPAATGEAPARDRP
jgi:hypothetical protein